MGLDVIDFRLTSNCNFSCPFCFGTKEHDNLSMEILRTFFFTLKGYGVRSVVLTGGEPTMSPRFLEIITMLHQLDFDIVISTNGSFWNTSSLRKTVLQYCRVIGLPMDSSVPSIHNALRPSVDIINHFEFIFKILPQIRKQSPKTLIKVETVVTKYNFETIASIIDVVPIKPDIWKLYQLSRTCTNLPYYQLNRVTSSDFSTLIKYLSPLCRSKNIKLSWTYEKDRSGSYLFLEPNGTLMTVINGRETIIGHYTDPVPVLFSNFRKYVDFHKTNINFSSSFSR